MPLNLYPVLLQLLAPTYDEIQLWVFIGFNIFYVRYKSHFTCMFAYIELYKTKRFCSSYTFIFYMYINASHYDNTLFSFGSFSCLTEYFFLHNTLVLSFYIDAILRLPILIGFLLHGIDRRCTIRHISICNWMLTKYNVSTEIRLPC